MKAKHVIFRFPPPDPNRSNNNAYEAAIQRAQEVISSIYNSV